MVILAAMIGLLVVADVTIIEKRTFAISFD